MNPNPYIEGILSENEQQTYVNLFMKIQWYIIGMLCIQSRILSLMFDISINEDVYKPDFGLNVFFFPHLSQSVFSLSFLL